MGEDCVATFLAEIGRLSFLGAPERELSRRGYRFVAGVDEVGRGCLAGPVVAAAIILPPGFWWPAVDDSKKTDAVTREVLDPVLRSRAVSFAIAEASAVEIDDTDIARASLLAMRRALEALSPQPDVVLTDAFRVPGYLRPQVPMLQGDANSLSIAAASILAKVARDAMMDELGRRWPAYGFGNHKGYAVEEHRKALAHAGPCPQHRLTFHGVVAEKLIP